MSDPASVLRPALKAWLLADSGVISAFGVKTPLVFSRKPPVNQAMPFIYLAGFDVQDDTSECLDATEVTVQVDVWSLTSPPDFIEAERISAAVKTSLALIADDITIANFRVVAVQFANTLYLEDPSDGKTVHAVISATISVDPVG